MTRRFEFEVGSDRLVGTLFEPTQRPIGAVVLTGPLTSVKEQAAGAYAKAMAERGFAALAFDHRTYGESGGEPRQLENPYGKALDIRAAVAALRADDGLKGLPVFAVGVCAGAGSMAAAVSQEPDILAFAGVAGYYSESSLPLSSAADAVRARGVGARRKRIDTGVADHIPAVAADGGDVGMPLREAYEFYGTPRGAVPNYTNAFAVESFVYTTTFDAVGIAPRIAQPTLVIHSEKALAPPLARKFIAGLPNLHGQLWLQSVGQIDFYDDPNLITPASDAIAKFFTGLK